MTLHPSWCYCRAHGMFYMYSSCIFVAMVRILHYTACFSVQYLWSCTITFITDWQHLSVQSQGGGKPSSFWVLVSDSGNMIIYYNDQMRLGVSFTQTHQPVMLGAINYWA